MTRNFGRAALGMAMAIAGPASLTAPTAAYAKDPGRLEAEQYRTSLERYRKQNAFPRKCGPTLGTFPDPAELHRCSDSASGNDRSPAGISQESARRLGGGRLK